MSIKILAQSSIRPGGSETEAALKTVSIESDAAGLFSHELMGSITIGEVKEVEGGVTINFHFNDCFRTDAWLNGNETTSFLSKTLGQIVETDMRIPPEFPEKVILTDVFLRRGGPSMELSIMKKPDSLGGCWEELSKIQISLSQ
ncbi:hypothetical protein KKH13_02440 [Patescibacteria group bacterium]|nr:hypothetical protein [Patescibacteria group bacterium]